MNTCYTFIYLFVRIHAIDNKVSLSWSNLRNEIFLIYKMRTSWQRGVCFLVTISGHFLYWFNPTPPPPTNNNCYMHSVNKYFESHLS